MGTQDGGHRDTAVSALAAREYERAGEEYTRAAWQVLADPRADTGPFDVDEYGWVGDGLAHLAVAALAFRVADHPERATHRAVEGVAVAQDLQETVGHAVQRACLAEFVADFRVAGDLTGASEAYESAAESYRDAGPETDGPQTWGTRPLFEAAATPLKQVARGLDNGEIAVTWEDLHGADPGDAGEFLAHRTTYKRQRFASLVERTVDEGYLAAPRGTTEYGNDHHRCPACGSTDVNWVADSTLCMRCSTPMDRV